MKINCLLHLFAFMLLIPTVVFVQSANPGDPILTIDCTKDYPADSYFQSGDVRVVESALGAYREAEGKPLSRFGYRFTLPAAEKPYLVVARYPDDKRRMMCVMDGTSYDLTEGVFTGFNQPLSGQMQEMRHIFWPRWQDCSLVFMTWGNGEPAAVSEIQIYELNDLPAMDIPAPGGDSPRRSVGVQFEDPCGKGSSLGALNPQQWQDRTIQYMRYTGQNLLTYPVVWYHGPHYPSDIEPSQDLGMVVAPDRKMYGFSTTQPTDWVSSMLAEFDKQGLQFKAALTLLRLGSLMKDMNIDLASIQAGKETYNNMRMDNKVQDGTQDWTTPYNALNGPGIGMPVENWVYGERTGTCSKGPMFNPLHPKVQNAILNLIREIAHKYGKFSSFRGVSLNVWHTTICWFATPEIGYDDYTVNRFSRETGIAVPGDATAADRFTTRYEFLMKSHRERWLSWRCERISDLFRAMRDVLIAERPDMQLTLNLWSETTVSQLLGTPGKPEHQLFARKSTYDVYRDGGVDARLLQNEPNISVDYVYTPARDRDSWGTDGLDMKLEQLCMFRDHDFLDDLTLSTMKEGRNPAAFIFDSWVEAWGKYSNFPCPSDDLRMKEYAKVWSIPEDRIRHHNSEYPKDGFWWDWQFRITPQFPSGIHYLENYAHAVAEMDALEITRGGLFLDTGHSSLIQPFARAFRALPAQKFETVGESTDPAAVRTLLCDGKRYLYIVNREYYPVQVSLKLSAPSTTALDCSTGQNITLDASNATIALGPYELRSFTFPPEARINGFDVVVPPQITNALTCRTNAALQQINALKKQNTSLPIGADRMVELIREAQVKKQYSRLRHALDSYIMRKCDQLAETRDTQ